MSQTLTLQDQMNLDSLSNLVERLESNPDIICDSECQNSKREKQLFNDYISAKNNLESAPLQLEEAENKYFKFKYSTNEYLDKATESIKQRIKPEIQNIIDLFNNQYTSIQNLKSQDSEIPVTLKNLGESTYILNENIEKLKENNEIADNSLNLANSKTFYAQENLQFWKSVNTVVNIIFMAIFVLVGIHVFYFMGKYRDVKYYLAFAGIYFFENIISVVKSIVDFFK